ncbi:MAG: hypothetical protein IT427_07595 [Pirellulales bacterium]|nr:hypothetical protein [Pirellulales bacterium]
MSSDQGKFDIVPTESEATGTAGNFPHGSRAIPATSAAVVATDRPAQARGPPAGVPGTLRILCWVKKLQFPRSPASMDPYVRR